jgi:hypothetical protein
MTLCGIFWFHDAPAFRGLVSTQRFTCRKLFPVFVRLPRKCRCYFRPHKRIGTSLFRPLDSRPSLYANLSFHSESLGPRNKYMYRKMRLWSYRVEIRKSDIQRPETFDYRTFSVPEFKWSSIKMPSSNSLIILIPNQYKNDLELFSCYFVFTIQFPDWL